MSRQPYLHALFRQLCLVTTIALAGALGVCAQEAAPPAYLASVNGEATLERDGVAEPATRNMPFVPGDRVRTAAGRVEIAFPDGSGVEVGEDSEVEAVSATRVRLLAGTMDHIQRPAAASRSASYLPTDLRPYGNTFDQYGSWQYDAAYGYVWYPSVGPEWRPYFHGSWSPIRSYGWTWIGLDAWAWPTHHYGRWGYARNSWFWIPGRTWGAAWVSWSFADDYVSWCPLGYDSRPVFALSVGYRRGWDYWIVPRRTFETRGYGRNYASYYRGGPRESIVGRQREPFIGNRNGRSTVNERTPNADRRTTADHRRPPQAGASLPGATGAAVAVPRVGTRDSIGIRDSGLGIRSRRPTTDDRQPTSDFRQRADVAVPRATAPERVNVPPTIVDRRKSVVGSPDRRPATNYRPPTADYRRPAADPRPTTDYRRPTTDSRPATIDSRPPTTASHRPTTDSRPPTTDSRRAAPSGGETRPRAQEGSAQGQGRRR
jgi:hypothetical protein